jgi:hypothetical protein
MCILLGLFFGLLLVALVVAISPALGDRSWKRFFSAACLSFGGIVFPLFIFVMSAILVPEWKGGCLHGWLDCFAVGKFALTPLVLWACAAFYVTQILRSSGSSKAWVVLGLFMGVIVSVVCFVFGLVMYALPDLRLIFLLVPLYVFIWYSTLCARAIRASGLRVRTYIIAFLGSLPLWWLSVILSKKHYLSLPDTAPCFIVTSALGGHEGLVGPFSLISRDGVVRIANQQLLTFWEFEAIWRDRSPNTHRTFRRIYNRVGPFVTHRIKTAFAADVVYLLIKPFEAFATLIVAASRKSPRNLKGDGAV